MNEMRSFAAYEAISIPKIGIKHDSSRNRRARETLARARSLARSSISLIDV